MLKKVMSIKNSPSKISWIKLLLSWLGGLLLFAGVVLFLVIAPVAFALSFVVQFPSVEKFVESNCFTTEMFQVAFCKDSKFYLTSKQIPPLLKRALTSSEDGSFYQHHGFDFEALRISYEKNLKEGRFKAGGSTITQQLAKNLFLSQEKSLGRKAKEVILTLQLEQKLTKEQILETYVNIVEFAPQTYGLLNAARFYFSKAPSTLTPSEILFLTTLLPSPKKFARSKASGVIGPFHGQQIKKIARIMWKHKNLTDHQVSLVYDRVDHGFWNYNEAEFEFVGLPAQLNASGDAGDSEIGENEGQEDQDAKMKDELGTEQSPVDPTNALEPVGEGEDQ